MVEIGLSNYYVVDERALRSCGINMTTSEDWTRLSWTSVWTSWVALAAICVFLFLKFTVSFLRQAIRKSKKSQGISSLRYVPFLKWLRGRHKCLNCKRCYVQICWRQMNFRGRKVYPQCPSWHALGVATKWLKRQELWWTHNRVIL